MIIKMFGIILCMFALGSCSRYVYSDNQFYKHEVVKYGFNSADTILDFSRNPEYSMPLIATTADNLFFYISSSRNAIDTTNVAKAAERYKKEFKSSNSFNYKRIDRDGSVIPLPASSINQALFITNMYHLSNFDTLTAELKRVLKPGGTIVMVQNVYNLGDITKDSELKLIAGKPYPNADTLIQYFSSRGFALKSQERIVFNKAMEKRVTRILFKFGLR